MHLNESGVPFPVPSDTKKQAADKLYSYVNAFNIDISFDVCLKEIDFLEMVLIKNQYLNLTAVRDFEKGIVLHLVDSLLYLKSMRKYCPFLLFDGEDDEKGYANFVDMGCGAGFPGIVLALAEETYRGLLCDSVKKKVNAVDEFISQLDLNAQLSTSSDRLETLATSHRGEFCFAIARALSSLPTVLEYAAPFLAVDGILVVSKGNPESSEVSRANRVASMIGFEHIDTEQYELPEDYGHRSIFVYGYNGNSRVSLPRAVGMAASSPLA
jgi:16S rRNA (guanine527-N7)-methyltransferase